MTEPPIGHREVQRRYLRVVGDVAASYDEVADVLLTVRPGPVTPDSCFILADDDTGLFVTGGPSRFAASTPKLPDAVRLEVDHDHGTISIQTRWWSLGVCRLLAADDDTQVVQEYFNIATHNRWLVPMISVRTTNRQRVRAQQLIRRLGERLSCRADLI